METLSKNKIKWIRSLQVKKVRDELNLFVVEGEKMVQEALDNQSENIEFICYTDQFKMNVISKRFESILISEKELKSISTLKTPNKAIAVLRRPKLKGTKKSFKIALDDVQDPGNMGTILRLADWFGVEELICSYNTVDCYNSKVIQASMGAIFRIQVTYTDLHDYLSASNLPIFGALLNGENVYSKKLKPEGILLMGNEGKGISEKLIPLINNPISIPRFGDAESLNVSIATGILLSEFFRNN